MVPAAVRISLESPLPYAVKPLLRLPICGHRPDRRFVQYHWPRLSQYAADTSMGILKYKLILLTLLFGQFRSKSRWLSALLITKKKRAASRPTSSTHSKLEYRYVWTYVLPLPRYNRTSCIRAHPAAPSSNPRAP